MLARNGALRNQPLRSSTKQNILDAHNKGVKFVVGDMPGVDSKFIDYLNSIGADYTIYHGGDNPRISIGQPEPKPVQADEGIHPVKNSALRWAPSVREEASEMAFGGRINLGISISTKNQINAAHAYVKSLKDDGRAWNTTLTKNINGKDIKVSVLIEPRVGEEFKNYVKLQRAILVSGMDPMDVIGVKSSNELTRIMQESAFKFKFTTKDGKQLTRKQVKFNNKDLQKIFSPWQKANSAIFGKKKFTWAEMQDELRPLWNRMGKEGSFLEKVTGLMYHMNFDFNLLNAMFSREQTADLFNLYNRIEKQGGFSGILKSMGRESGALLLFKGKNWVGQVMRSGVYNRNVYSQQLWLDSKWYDKFFDSLAVEYRERKLGKHQKGDYAGIKDLSKYYMDNKEQLTKNQIYELRQQRKANLDLILEGSSRMLSEDITTATTMMVIKDIRDGIPKEKHEAFDKMTGEFSKFIDQQKKLSVYRKSRAKKVTTYDIDKMFEDTVSAESSKSMHEEINNRIGMFKKGMNPTERLVFDVLALGSLNPNENKTSVSVFGLSSDNIDDTSIEVFFRKFNDTVNKTRTVTQEHQIEEWRKDWNESLLQMEANKDLIPGQSKAVFYNRYGDNAKSFLDSEDALVKIIHNKKLPKEAIERAQKIHVEIRDKLKSMPNHKFLQENIHKLVRGMYYKNMDNMTLTNWEDFNRFLDSTKKVGFFEKMIGKAFGEAEGHGYPTVQKFFWHLFPERVHRYLMSFGLETTEDYGVWRRSKGGVVRGEVLKPTSIFAKQMQFAELVERSTTAAHEKIRGQLDDKTRHLVNYFGKDWLRVYKLINATREAEGWYHDFDQKKAAEEGLSQTKKEINYDELIKKYGGVLKIKTLEKPDGAEYTFNGVVQEGRKIFTNFFAEFHKVFSGDPTTLSQIRFRDNDGKLNPDRFEKYITDFMKKGKDIPWNLGIDVLNEYAVEFYKNRLGERGIKKHSHVVEELKKVGLYRTRTGQTDFNKYYPHIYSKAKLEEYLEKKIEAIKNNNTLDDRDKAEQMINVARDIMQTHHNGSRIAASLFDEDFQSAVYQAVSDNKEAAKNGMKKLTDNIRTVFTGSMMSRKGDMTGHIVEEHIVDEYIRSNLNAYYRGVAHVLSNNSLNKWGEYAEKVGYPQENVGALKKFMQLYMNQAVGHYTVIPDNYLNDPALQLNGTVYSKLADDKVAKRIQGIREKLGITKTKTFMGEEIKLDEFEPRDVVRWANLEAKFSLATLLTHFKSAAANVYSGYANTIISTGPKNLKRAKSFKYLSAINPKWKSMADVNTWVHELGVVEELFLEQLGGEHLYKKRSVREFISEAGKLYASGKGNKTNFRDLARRYNVSKTAFEKMAWFMRVPERYLRRDAFMSHLVQAYEEFDGVLSINDPVLIDIAKKGVKSTQFLYSSPFKPMFANTGAGKIITRFQLWAWNSTRFRNDIIKGAEDYGYRQGSPEFDRYKRFMIMDMLMLGLSSAFIYSLFEAALPQPYSWMQDWADLFFGNDKERDRAFFGSYPSPLQPLQMITPISLRLVGPSVKAMIDGDWSRVANYHVWTMFPFGRMARDFFQKPSGIVHNPSRLFEKTFGIPFQDFARQWTSGDEIDFPTPKGMI